jgi:hypothetical protein
MPAPTDSPSKARSLLNELFSPDHHLAKLRIGNRHRNILWVAQQRLGFSWRPHFIFSPDVAVQRI